MTRVLEEPVRLSVFTASTPKWDPAEAARRIAGAGYEGVEWRILDQKPAPPGEGPGYWAGNRATWSIREAVETPELLLETAEAAGLEISAFGCYTTHQDLETVDALLGAAARIGVPRMRVNTVPLAQLEDHAYPELLDRSRREIGEVARRAAHHGVQALVELHPGTLVASASAAMRLLEDIDPRHVGVIHDLGNVITEGFETLRASVDMLGEHLAHVHVKNSRPTHGPDGWRWEFCPIDQGFGDLTDYLAQMRRVGYDGWVTLEDFADTPGPDEKLTRNARIVRRIWDDVDPASESASSGSSS
ncbi:MAG: sugar phosphate isomerase/epimerase family protein [Brachybacterium sp.]|nr:sugar phosphate isomerase/epimerase family protein [Brachybacterium sp.]